MVAVLNVGEKVFRCMITYIVKEFVSFKFVM